MKEPELIHVGAESYGRNDFLSLWSPCVLGCGNFDAGQELCQFVVVDDVGAWLNADEAGGLKWSPHMHAPTAGGHWRDRPVLPFPFTPGELAAFMLDGPGWWLTQAFGGLDRIDERGRHAPDLSMLTVRIDRSAATRRPALLLALAWEAYGAAVAAVGPRPVDPADAATTSDAKWIAAASTERASQANGNPWQVATPPRTVDETEWLDGMCQQLLGHAPDRAAAAGPVSAEIQTAQRHGGTGKRWLPDVLAQLVEYHATHGTKAASERFGIHESRVRKLLKQHRDASSAAPSDPADATPTAHIPFPSRTG